MLVRHGARLLLLNPAGGANKRARSHACRQGRDAGLVTACMQSTRKHPCSEQGSHTPPRVPPLCRLPPASLLPHRRLPRCCRSSRLSAFAVANRLRQRNMHSFAPSARPLLCWWVGGKPTSFRTAAWLPLPISAAASCRRGWESAAALQRCCNDLRANAESLAALGWAIAACSRCLQVRTAPASPQGPSARSHQRT